MVTIRHKLALSTTRATALSKMGEHHPTTKQATFAACSCCKPFRPSLMQAPDQVHICHTPVNASPSSGLQSHHMVVAELTRHGAASAVYFSTQGRWLPCTAKKSVACQDGAG